MGTNTDANYAVEELKIPTKTNKNEISKDNQEDNDTNNQQVSNAYQPISFEAYKFFTKFSPFVEKIILNNINKNILKNQNLQDNNKVNKMDKDFRISEDLLNYVNNSGSQNFSVTFSSN
jgi:hypothetical protein